MKRKFGRVQTAFRRVDDDLHLILVHHTRQTTLFRREEKRTDPTRRTICPYCGTCPKCQI